MLNYPQVAFAITMASDDDYISVIPTGHSDEDAVADDSTGCLTTLRNRSVRGAIFGVLLTPTAFPRRAPIPCRTSRLRGQDWVAELLNGNETRIFEQFRVTKDMFQYLCNLLGTNGYLDETMRRRIGIEESIGLFLTTVGLNHTQRDNAERFQHSTETVNRHVRACSRAIAQLAPDIIVPPDLQQVPIEIERNTMWYPFFKDAVGAIDGTLIPAYVPRSTQSAHRTRRGAVAQNIIAACAFDMTFTFVVIGWEGSANDSRVFLHALSQPQFNFPWPPPGKYYLVDAGFANFPGFLSPYRKERYDLPEFAGEGRGPRTRVELFNRVHSSIRNHIERCFGIIKKRFPFLTGPMNNYEFEVQKDMVMSCFVLHNLIVKYRFNDPLMDELMAATNNDTNEHFLSVDEEVPSSTRLPALGPDDTWAQAELRDSIANNLWNARHLFNARRRRR